MSIFSKENNYFNLLLPSLAYECLVLGKRISDRHYVYSLKVNFAGYCMCCFYLVLLCSILINGGGKNNLIGGLCWLN